MNGALLILLLAFLLGSIPFGLLMARVFGRHDPRARGSGNIGATNVTRVAGFWPAGFLTFLLDALKGTLAVALAGSLLSQLLGLLLGPEWIQGNLAFPGHWEPGSALLRWSAGFFAVLGHCYSPWLRLRGGKGVSTALGALALLAPVAALGGVAAFVVTFFSFRTGSLASLAGLLMVAVVYGIFPSAESGVPGPHLWPGALMLLVVIARHEKNIDALLEDREARF